MFETHVQADHVSGLPALVERTGATPYLPEAAGVDFEHQALGDEDVVELGNTVVTAVSTPGHAPAHLAFTVADRRRGTLEPWLVFTGDSLLIGDVGRPDLHAKGDPTPLARRVINGSANYGKRWESSGTAGRQNWLNQAKWDPLGKLLGCLPCRRSWVRAPSSASRRAPESAPTGRRLDMLDIRQVENLAEKRSRGLGVV